MCRFFWCGNFYFMVIFGDSFLCISSEKNSFMVKQKQKCYLTVEDVFFLSFLNFSFFFVVFEGKFGWGKSQNEEKGRIQNKKELCRRKQKLLEYSRRKKKNNHFKKKIDEKNENVWPFFSSQKNPKMAEKAKKKLKGKKQKKI